MRVQDVQVGKQVFYYSFADKYENAEPEPAVITSGPIQLASGELCCMIDIRPAVVALSNLSEDKVPARRMTTRKRMAKERYQRFLNGDGIYDGITFGDFCKYKL